MRLSSGPDSFPASHTAPSREGAPRGGLRALCTRTTLTGGLTELAWVGAHLLMYPLGTRTEELRPDPRIRPGEQPPGVRALFAADPLAARIPVVLVHGLVDNRSVFSVMRRGLPQARVHPDLHLELQPAADRRRPRGRRPRRAHRADLRADGARPRARRRPQPRRPDRPLLRPAAGRRPAGRVAGDARDAAPRARSSRTCCPRRWSASCGRAPRCCGELEEPAAGLHAPG